MLFTHPLYLAPLSVSVLAVDGTPTELPPEEG